MNYLAIPDECPYCKGRCVEAKSISSDGNGEVYRFTCICRTGASFCNRSWQEFWRNGKFLFWVEEKEKTNDNERISKKTNF